MSLCIYPIISVKYASMKFARVKIAKIAKKLIRHKLLLALPAGAVVISIVLLSRSSGTEVETATVSVNSITSEITASGKVQSQNSATLMFSTSGKIAAVYLKEGDHIAKGRAIASLEAEPFLVALRQAQQEVNKADAVLSQVYDEQKKQTAAENFDQKIRRTNAETAKNQAYDSMRKAEFDAAHAIIYSPQDGVITKINFQSGQQVNQTSEFGQVNDLTNIEFAAEVDETDIGRVKLGQKAIITLDAYSSEPIEASVTYIADTATTTSTGATAFVVKISLPQDTKYKIGMGGEANVVTKEKSNVLTIPLSAIIDEKYVYIQDGKTYSKKEIILGIESDTEVEIVSGLTAGQSIVTSGFEQVEKKAKK